MTPTDHGKRSNLKKQAFGGITITGKGKIKRPKYTGLETPNRIN